MTHMTDIAHMTCMPHTTCIHARTDSAVSGIVEQIIRPTLSKKKVKKK